MAGDCGSCTLCYTVMRVKADDHHFDKPARTRCDFECGKGCSIYERRPEVCRVFSCVWLVSQDKPGFELPQHERPDRAGMVLECNTKGTVIAHLVTPERWRDPKNFKRLMIFNRSTNVTIDHGNGRTSILEKDGTLSDIVQVGTAANGETMIVRRKELAAFYADGGLDAVHPR